MIGATGSHYPDQSPFPRFLDLLLVFIISRDIYHIESETRGLKQGQLVALDGMAVNRLNMDSVRQLY